MDMYPENLESQTYDSQSRVWMSSFSKQSKSFNQVFPKVVGRSTLLTFKEDYAWPKVAASA